MNEDAHPDPRTQALPPPRRVARREAPIVGAAILADVSSSMDARDDRNETGPRRIDRLAKVLDYLLTRVRVQALVCFNDLPVEIALSGRVALPEPDGSTNLALGLEHIASLRPAPTRLIVLSDGMPNSVEDALSRGRKLAPMTLDCYYIGPDAFAPALAFMRDLAGCGGPGGRSGNFDLVDPVLLGSELHRRLLTGPGR